MMLLDSLHINDSGGKVLLDYLVKKIEETDILCFYMFDSRLTNNFKSIPENRKIFMNATLFARRKFYQTNHLKFSTVLCFGNLPPSIKLNIPVYTYFHQTLFLKVPSSFSFRDKLKIKLKTIILNSIKSNTDKWFVQSEFIQQKLAQKYRIDLDKVKVLPFYPPLDVSLEKIERRKDGFVYISNGGIHKNHKNLIQAFCKFFDESKKGVLQITVSKKFPQIVELVTTKINDGYPIVNHGFIRRNRLAEIYQRSEYLIFPSLSESFGLGLVEAIENGCKVIGSDLPYTYAVCEPSLKFDPLLINDIVRVFQESQNENIKPTKQLVFNQIEELLSMLQ